MRAVVLLFLFLLACSSDAATQVVVIIDADPQVKAQATDLRLVVTDLSGGTERPVHDDRESPPKRAFPHRLTLQPTAGDATRTYRLEARAVAGDRTVATARLISGYVSSETRYVRVVLEDLCIAKECGAAQTCGAGACVDARRDVANFSTSEASAPNITSVGTQSGNVDQPVDDGGAGGGRDQMGAVPDDAATLPPDDAGEIDSGSPRIIRVTANGSACPSGTHAAAIAADGLSVTVGLRAFELEVSPAAAVSTKDCELRIGVSASSGRQFQLSRASLRGRISLAQGMSGRLQVNTYFEGAPTDGDEWLTPLNGPRNEALSLDNAEVTQKWSPCGLDRDYAVRFTGRLSSTQAPDADGFIQVDQLQVLGLKARDCGN